MGKNGNRKGEGGGKTCRFFLVKYVRRIWRRFRSGDLVKWGRRKNVAKVPPSDNISSYIFPRKFHHFSPQIDTGDDKGYFLRTFTLPCIGVPSSCCTLGLKAAQISRNQISAATSTAAATPFLFLCHDDEEIVPPNPSLRTNRQQTRMKKKTPTVIKQVHLSGQGRKKEPQTN